ncbi:hypothetical protein ACFU76_23470, partial [Streptomyces sp. NPDC057539]|uniref:hypothetical protein n=1 Tax=Streptomyces sp. NPDC057539 TaxID=3346159 RepID=UPI0036C46F1E
TAGSLAVPGQRVLKRRYFTPTARMISCLTDPPRSSVAQARSERYAASFGIRTVPSQAAGFPPARRRGAAVGAEGPLRVAPGGQPSALRVEGGVRDDLVGLFGRVGVPGVRARAVPATSGPR